jgi:D-beta-D-heptose 7-phosphate kinase / D-beta-D-heptose 1-phosphate adenosyltransferase
MKNDTIDSFLSQLETGPSPQLACIGDVMLDRYVYGRVTRISPEAPIPVMHYAREDAMPGAAANVARNAAALGATVTLVAPTGDDPAADTLEQRLVATPGLAAQLLRHGRSATIVKTRYVAGGQQVMRLDQEPEPETWAPVGGAFTEASCEAVRDADAVLVSDYAKGAVTRSMMAAVCEAARRAGAPVIVDPKLNDWSVYGPVDLIKPNAAELAAATDLPAGSDGEVEVALRAAAARFPARGVLVTRAEKGMSYLDGKGEVQHHRGEPVEVFDVSGAGDTSLAAMGLALAAGLAMPAVAAFATLASRIAVTRRGTAMVGLPDIRASLGRPARRPSGDFALEPVQALVDAWRADGLKVGFTNGCFDILHVGHLTVIEEARARCDRLVVGVNTDASVRRLKGVSRPVNGEQDRARLLEGLAAVDAVALFDDDTPLALIRALEPDLLVKGGDYRPETIVGHDETIARGGEVHIVPLVEGRSTTATIASLRDD